MEDWIEEAIAQKPKPETDWLDEAIGAAPQGMVPSITNRPRSNPDNLPSDESIFRTPLANDTPFYNREGVVVHPDAPSTPTGFQQQPEPDGLSAGDPITAAIDTAKSALTSKPVQWVGHNVLDRFANVGRGFARDVFKPRNPFDPNAPRFEGLKALPGIIPFSESMGLFDPEKNQSAPLAPAGESVEGEPYLNFLKGAVNFAANTVTDPTMYVGIGELGLGAKFAREGVELAANLQKAGKIADPLARAVETATARLAFEKATGKLLPPVLDASFTGKAGTLAERLRGGESGVSFMGQPIAPLHRGAGAVLDMFQHLPMMPEAQAAAASFLKPFRAPNIHTAAGLAVKGGEDVAGQMANNLAARLREPLDEMAKAGATREQVAELVPLVEGFDIFPKTVTIPYPKNVTAVPLEQQLLRADGRTAERKMVEGMLREPGELRAAVGKVDLREAADAAIARLDMPSVKPEVRAAIFASSEKVHRILNESLAEMQARGVKVERFGADILDQPARIQAQIDALEQQWKEVMAAPPVPRSGTHDFEAISERELGQALDETGNAMAAGANDPMSAYRNAKYRTEAPSGEIVDAWNKDTRAEAKALGKQIEALEVDLSLAKKKAAEVPNYFPMLLDRNAIQAETAQALDALKMGKPGGGTLKQRKSRFSEGDLADVPMTIAEKNAEAMRGGTGMKATLGSAPEVKTDWYRGLANRLTGKGNEEAAQEAANASHMIFDPGEALSQYVNRRYYMPINKAELDQNAIGTFNAFPVESWQKVVSGVQAGEIKTLEEANALFKKSSGLKVEDVLHGDVVDALKGGQTKLRDALKPSAVPHGWVETALNGDAMYLPAGAAQKLMDYKIAATKNLGETLNGMAGAHAWYIQNIWKPMQTYAGPGFFKYNVRNAMGDVFRMYQGRLLDLSTPRDFGQLLAPFKSGEAIKDGFGNPALWEGKQIFLGEGGIRTGLAGPNGYAHMPEFIQFGLDHGMVNTGFTRHVLLDQAERSLKRNWMERFLPGKAQGVPEVFEQYKNIMAVREDMQRLSGLAARMRAGDHGLQASLRVEDALFNFTRMSPAAQWLRKTGMAPFISWQSKNVPFQVQWAIEHPGEFAAALRVQEMIKGQEIPEHLIPEYAKNQYGLTVRQETVKDARTGRTAHKWYTVTTDGLNPMDDLTNLANAPVMTAVKMFGPLAQIGGLSIAKAARVRGTKGMDLTDEAYKQFGGAATQLVPRQLENALGLPIRPRPGEYDPRTKELAPGYGESFLKNFISPAAIRTLRVEDEMERAKKRIDRAYSEAHTAQKKAGVDLRLAQLLESDLTVTQRAVQDADAAMKEATEARDRRRKEDAKLRKYLTPLKLAD